jgi:ComF family protein
VLSTLLARGYVKQHFLFPDFWVPVPLHSSIKQARGFNQAEELALSLAELSAKPLLLGGIERVKKTQNQKQLGSLERQANMKNAFACCIDLHGKTIGIVDDVITTGATVGALTTTLLDAGAADVQVVCVARTPAK